MTHRITFVAALAMASLLCTPCAAAPASTAAQDARAVKDYKLTMAVVEKIAKANDAAKKAAAKDPKQQKLAKLEAELKALDAKDDLTEAEHERMRELEDELERGADEDDDGMDLGSGVSLDEFARRVDGNPALAAALRSAGLSSREYATAVFALLEAGMVDGLMEQGLLKSPPPEASVHNLQFVRQNRARLTTMGVLTQDDD